MRFFFALFSTLKIGVVSKRGGRVVEGARLESVYTPQGYRGFRILLSRMILILKKFINILYL